MNPDLTASPRSLDPISDRLRLAPGSRCNYRRRCEGLPAFYYTKTVVLRGRRHARLTHVCSDCAATIRAAYPDTKG